MTDVQTAAPTVLHAQARVRAAERISPTFVRVTLESPAFDDLGSPGFDTRFALVFPGPTGQLPSLSGCAEEWYDSWSLMPDATRSPMRTYTIREVLRAGDASFLVVDVAVHEDGPQGPGCRWALGVRPGDQVQVVAPHRGNGDYAGVEFDPQAARRLLLVADETALPALARILADLGPGYTGHAFVEVPSVQDVLGVAAPEGVEVHWVLRQGARHGRRVVDRARDQLGLGPLDPGSLPVRVRSNLDVEVWETARYSSAGEDLQARHRPPSGDSGLADLYAWVAGESWMVKAMRRSLVTELGVERGQVAFMGYWREGVAMTSRPHRRR